jgi:phosphomannomutase/phosphoglucomutase
VSIFKACDIRGRVGEGLTEDIARCIGRSLGAMIARRGGGPISVGGDHRRSTPPLKAALTRGLIEAGATVRDLGQGPTPMHYFAANRLACPHAAVVTASHNPPGDNGVKFMVANRPGVPALVAELQAGLDAPPAPEPGRVEPADVRADYERAVPAHAAALIDASPAGMKIVIDAMGGAFAGIGSRALVAAGCNVIALADTIDPDYADRAPNPAVDANLAELRQRVTETSADLGIAWDGDGDRVTFIDNHAQIARPEQIGALLVQHAFDRPTVVYDLKCASVLARAVERAAGRTIMQPSGHGFIKSTMIDHHAELGVEVSGHFFFQALRGGDDGLFTALVITRLLARTARPLADLLAEIGWPAITPDLRIPFEGDADATLERIASTCGGDITTLDGVRAAYDDGWALARASITEPVMTFRVEGRDPAALRAIASRFLSAAPELAAQVTERIDEQYQ